VLPARVEFLKNLYKLPAEKCELLVMGADDDLVEAAAKPEVRATIRQKYHIADDDFLIMTGGKIDQFKTQTLLLMEAVQKINDPKVKLIVFGSIATELKEKVAALTDGTKVQNIGWIQAKDSYQYFAAADLVVFPGRHSVFWEQVAAQGIPMLCKKWDGTTHVDVGGNVEFLTEDSASEIQEKIVKIISNPEKYQKMKTIAQEKGMIVFSYREIAKRSVK
ncbi:MAG: glycosyltransferase, partial [Clostridiales bacterium]|nr:glycosyltransferase [Clostridiales bacterium]